MYRFNILFLIFTIFLKLHLSLTDQCVITKFEDVSNVVATCKDIVINNLIVPEGQQLTLQLTEGSTLVFRGTTLFEYFVWTGPLMIISGNNITVIGEPGSSLDGQGPLYWDGQGTWGTTKPRFLTITATNAILESINIKNCPVGCTSVYKSENLTIRNWKIDNLQGDEGVASENKFGHNTDGIGIKMSKNILVEDSIIYNQDDCIGLNSGTHLIVRNMFCHGSHGLSLSVATATIEDVIIENSIITMAENGIHIKTHVNAGDGLIKDVLYRNITMLDCKYYGINIQQNYVNLPAGQPEDGPPKNNIPIHNLTMSNIYGSVQSGAVPVFILCAEDGCFDWTWEGVEIYGTAQDNCTNFTPDGYEC
ncbi:polygalacturonase-like [Anthonomus grandis grandis]|uniref:polygalacturonase-like n=1 Tax=Anthonomus grandis grandis TaxID=2921223 RepID=UPI00216580BE|nr:polygalacturonase-like [Anthonomus grandis grandis]